MRMQGTLKKWNAAKAYGFISQGQGKPDLFVHISGFQKNGQTPQTGEVLTFDVVQGQDGRWQAVRVLRQGETQTLALEPIRHSPKPQPSTKETTAAHTRHPARIRHRPAKKASRLWRFFPVVVVAAGIWGYQSLIAPRLASSPNATQNVGDWNTMRTESQGQQRFQCDGRQHCSQMTSCAEAEYFLANCPDVKMDGNGDGVPCEQQWCGG